MSEPLGTRMPPGVLARLDLDDALARRGYAFAGFEEPAGSGRVAVAVNADAHRIQAFGHDEVAATLHLAFVAAKPFDPARSRPRPRPIRRQGDPTMTPDELRTVKRSRFLQIYENAASRYYGRGPSRGAILTQLDRLGITDEAARDRILADAKRIAESRRDEGGLVARQRANRAVLALESEITQTNDLLGEGLAEPAMDRQQAASVADSVHEAGMIGGHTRVKLVDGKEVSI